MAAVCKPRPFPYISWHPRQESNLCFGLRRPALYPLSYGGIFTTLNDNKFPLGCQSITSPIVFRRLQSVHPALELPALQHDSAAAFEAPHADIRTNACDLPLEASAWMLLPHARDVPHPYLYRTH